MAGSADVVVIGAGVFGLSSALALARAGAAVTVLECATPGAGASGGPVGALAPHLPERWRDFNRFHLEALSALPGRIRWLADKTGHDPGYARIGRLTPLSTEGQRERTAINARAAARRWGDAGRYDLLDAPPPGLEDWLPEASRPFGIARDTLSARIRPRGYVAALAEGVTRSGGRLRLGAPVHRIDPVAGSIALAGETLRPGRIVLAAGWRGFALLQGALIACRGVKGQAALLDARVPDGLPMIYAEGLYIVPHADGTVAVGSTSEAEWGHVEPDRQLDTLIERARALCPRLGRAPVLSRWAGVRPRAPGREPMVGRHPRHRKLIFATGGFRIGFGIAHAIGDAVAAIVTGDAPPIALPAECDPAVHLGT